MRCKIDTKKCTRHERERKRERERERKFVCVCVKEREEGNLVKRDDLAPSLLRLQVLLCGLNEVKYDQTQTAIQLNSNPYD